MYPFLCLVAGVLLAFVITLNGSLTSWYGAWVATVIVHIVGTVVSYGTMKAMGGSGRAEERIPLWMYTGGPLGLITTVCQSLAFGQLGVTPILALSLFGQTVTALLVDTFGIGGMEKQRISKGAVLGLVISLCGVAYLLQGAGDMKVYAMVMSMASGVSSVLSRMVNARLSGKIGAAGGSFANHWTGLLGALVLMPLLQPNFVSVLQLPAAPWWMYLGGACGVFMVMLWNAAGQKVSAFRLTLLSFVGQVFAGIALDMLLGSGLNSRTFVGGSFVVVGIFLNMFLDRKDTM